MPVCVCARRLANPKPRNPQVVKAPGPKVAGYVVDVPVADNLYVETGTLPT